MLKKIYMTVNPVTVNPVTVNLYDVTALVKDQVSFMGIQLVMKINYFKILSYIFEIHETDLSFSQ